MSYGRMNPPTVGHGKLVDKIHSVAKEKNADHLLVLSHSHDPKKNPLSPSEKLTHAKRFFPKTNIKTADKEAPSYLHHLANAHKAGYKHVTMVVGSDRVPEFEKVIHKYNGHFNEKGEGFHFKSVHVVSAGHRDPDAPGVEGMSASKMRAYAQHGKYDEFKKGVPSHVPDHHAKELYDNIRKNMKVNEEMERELFATNRIYVLNEIVVDVETGERGIITMRGPNFVALKLESGITVKRWITLIESIDDRDTKIELVEKKTLGDMVAPVIFYPVNEQQVLEDIKTLRWGDIQELYSPEELTEGRKHDRKVVLKLLRKETKGLRKSSSSEEMRKRARDKALSILARKILGGRKVKLSDKDKIRLHEELDKYKELQSRMIARLIPIMREIEYTRMDRNSND